MEMIEECVKVGTKSKLNSFNVGVNGEISPKDIENPYAIENFLHGKQLDFAYDFFENNGVRNIDEITTELFLEYCLSRRIGYAKILSLKEVLIQIYFQYNYVLDLKYCIFDISFCFCYANQHFIREYFCEKSIWSITDERMKAFIKEKKIGEMMADRIKGEIEKCKNNVHQSKYFGFNESK